MTATRATGIAAYGVALACCVAAWVRAERAGVGSGLPASLAAIQSILLLDMFVDGRWRLHAWFSELARRGDAYELRQTPQKAADLILTGAFLLVVFFAFRKRERSKGAFLALCGTSLSLLIWCLEIVSLHQADSIFYHYAGRWMAVSLLWIAACLMTSAGILADSVRRIPVRPGAGRPAVGVPAGNVGPPGQSGSGHTAPDVRL